MSSILGIYDRRGNKVDRELLSSLLISNGNQNFDGLGAWTAPGLGLASQYSWVTPEEMGESQPITGRDGSIILSADLRLDNREEIARALGLDRISLAQLSDTRLLLYAYQRWSTRCVEKLLGDFAFALWDAQQQHLFVARDPLGVRQLYYFNSKDLFLAASDISSILAHPAVTPAVNEGMVAEFLAEAWDNHHESFFEDVFYCPPGHSLLASSAGLTTWRYWDIDPGQRLRYSSEQEYADHYLDLLRQAVRCRLRANGPIGVSLSGGLDSTPVAALAAQMLPEARPEQKNLLGFSYVFDRLAACDERRFIQPVAQQYQIETHYVFGDDLWPLRDLDTWPVPRDPLDFDPYFLLTKALVEKAGDTNCRLLLTGYYGDFLYTGRDYWAAGLIYDRRWQILFDQLAKRRRDFSWRQDFGRKGFAQFLAPPIRRRWPRQAPAGSTENDWPAIDARLVNRTDLAQRAWNPPDYDRFSRPASWHRWNAMNSAHAKKVLAASRAQWNRMGVERYDVFHDRRLVEFAMAIPTYQLGLPGLGRNREIMRRAMKGILPESVRLREDKTAFYDLYEEGVRHQERHTIEKLLSDPAVVQLGFVNPDWLAAQLPKGCGRRGDGFALWRCVVLELWLQRHWRS